MSDNQAEKKPTTRFERFMGSQVIWILALVFLLVIDATRSANGGLLIGGTIVFAFLLNLAVWFGEGLSRVFDDDFYEETIAQKATEESIEKRKRDRIDNVLRELSDDDLLILRQRLQDGVVDDDVLYEHMVGDDGELMSKQS